MELKDLLEQYGKAFEEYKAANDARIEELKKGSDAGELTAKVAKLETELKRLEDEKSAIEARLNRPGKAPEDEKAAGYRKAFGEWARKGIELKDITTGTSGDGGYAVPDVINMNVYNLLTEAVPMRSVCSVISTGSNNYHQLIGVHGAAAGWVGETDPRPSTGTPQLARVDAVMGEVYANPQASQSALDDIAFDVEGWLASEIAQQFAVMENAAYTVGDGSKKPKGLFAYATAATADKTRAFGTLQHIKTGVAGAFGANPGDNLIDVIAALKSGHLNGARWMMTRQTMAEIRKIKDNDNNYLWQPGLQAGVAGTLLGYPITLNDDMAEIGTDALAVAFGNFAAAYTIVDRIGIRMLRDPFTNKPYVGFYSTKRTGGFLKDSEAVKLLKFSA